MNDATAYNKLKPHKWKLYNSADAGLLPDGQIQRYIEGIQHRDAPDLVRFLERFVDCTNYDADATIRYAYVTDPLLENQPKSGNWRHVRTEIQRVDNQGRVGPDGTTLRLVQTLAEGFLTALPGADARLIQGRSNTGDGATNDGAEYLTLAWVGVNPDTVKALADGKLSTSTLSGLTYRKIANDGTTVTVALGDGWHCLSSNWELAQDGSGTVRLGVAKPEYTLSGFTNWLGSRQGGVTQYFDVPEALAQGILDAAKDRGVDTRASGYNREEGLVSLTVTELDLTGVSLSDVLVSQSCDFKEYADFAWGVGNPELDALIVTGAGTAKVNQSYSISGNTQGKYTYQGNTDSSVTIIWDINQWKIRSPFITLLYTSTDDVATPNLVTTWTVSAGDSPAPVNISAVPQIPLTIPPGTIYNRSVNENGDGSFSVVLRKRVRQYRNLDQYTSQHRADQTATTKEWKGVTDQDLGTALDAITGKVVEVQKSPNDDCSDDIRRVIRTPVNQPTTSGEVRHDQSSTVTEHTQADAAVTAPPTAAAGTISRVQNKETEFGKFATREETITAKDQTSTSYVKSAYQAETIVRNTHAATAAADPGTVSEGTLKRTVNRPTPYGDFETEVMTGTVTAQDTGWFDAGDNRNGTVMKRLATGQTEANAKTIADSSPPGNWFTIGSVSGPDRYGTFTASVTATVAEAGYSITVPYKSYSFEVSGQKRQYRTKDGKTQGRIVNVTHRYAGDTSETDVKNYLENGGSDDFDGIRITPNGTGEYFQGYAYKIGTVDTHWTDDDTEA